MRLAALLASLVLLVAVSHASSDEQRPFLPGKSSVKLEGLKCSIVMPDEWDATKERSMLLVLHGAGGTEDGMAASLASLAEQNYVIVAPKSAGDTWADADLEAVKRIVADLKKRLHVGERRLHACGFSNGGWNLAPVALDEGLRFQTACWVASGFKGGKVPKHAKKEMGVIALAGSEDDNKDAAMQTPKLLEDKVRSAEVHIQPGLGHAWPDKLVPYYSWWLGVQEGRFFPGICAAFDWKGNRDAALADAATAKTGAFVYWYSTGSVNDEKAKAFQNDTLRDPLVQHFGRQLAGAKIAKESDVEGFAKAGLKATPAVIVYDAAGKVKAVLEAAKTDAKSLSAALRSVAPDKTLPKD